MEGLRADSPRMQPRMGRRLEEVPRQTACAMEEGADAEGDEGRVNVQSLTK